MNPSSPYFMHDQVHHRVAHIMRARKRPALLREPVWPLVAIIAALTFVNVVAVLPPI